LAFFYLVLLPFLAILAILGPFWPFLAVFRRFWPFLAQTTTIATPIVIRAQHLVIRNKPILTYPKTHSYLGKKFISNHLSFFYLVLLPFFAILATFWPFLAHYSADNNTSNSNSNQSTASSNQKQAKLDSS
jgi:hypothetical protein